MQLQAELEGMHLIGSPPVCTKASAWGLGLPKALTGKQQEETTRNSPAMMRMMKVSDDKMIWEKKCKKHHPCLIFIMQCTVDTNRLCALCVVPVPRFRDEVHHQQHQHLPQYQAFQIQNKLRPTLYNRVACKLLYFIYSLIASLICDQIIPFI